MCQVQKVTSGSVFKALRPVSGTRGTLQGWLVTSICLLFPISSRTFISWPRRWAASLPLAPSLLESSGSLGGGGIEKKQGTSYSAATLWAGASGCHGYSRGGGDPDSGGVGDPVSSVPWLEVAPALGTRS